MGKVGSGTLGSLFPSWPWNTFQLGLQVIHRDLMDRSQLSWLLEEGGYAHFCALGLCRAVSLDSAASDFSPPGLKGLINGIKDLLHSFSCLTDV